MVPWAKMSLAVTFRHLCSDLKPPAKLAHRRYPNGAMLDGPIQSEQALRGPGEHSWVTRGTGVQ